MATLTKRAPHLSPDGLKIAFTSVRKRKHSFMILDVLTEKLTSVDFLSHVQGGASLSWSPDSKRLVVQHFEGSPDTPGLRPVPYVAVADLGAGELRDISGSRPWPGALSEDWIAFFDEAREKCMLVHPDGSGGRVVREARKLLGHRMLYRPAIWSPDGDSLLLNELKGESAGLDVMLVEIATGKVSTVSKNGLEVFGWSRLTK